MNTGFIILRHVNSDITNKYWIESYNCIRKLYPENAIVIIDDNSNYDYITNITVHNTTIINSEYKGCGELLPYYYYSLNKWFDQAVIIHDSVFIKKMIDFSVDKCKILWSFEHWYDNMQMEIYLISLLDNNAELINFYNNKELWKGCFGGMSIISHDYLKFVNDKYNFSKLLEHVRTREYRCYFERVISTILQCNHNHYNKFLLGDIHNYCNWGYTFDQYITEPLDLPIIKVWTGR